MRYLFLHRVCLAMSLGPAISALAQQTASAPADAIVVATTECKAERPAKMSLASIFGRGAEPLTRKGTLAVDGERFEFFLPAPPYALANSGKGDQEMENTASRISVDDNHDGKLSKDEHWFLNLPVRFGERMFRVTRIADDGSEIVFQPQEGPASGALVGRRMPGFSYRTMDGKPVSLESYRGKAFLLDIWSVT